MSVLVPARLGGATLIAILTASGSARAQQGGTRVVPVLDYPQAGVDDSASYQGYRTRFYRDAAKNTVQVYLDSRSGRTVLVWADALNESAGFTARSDGRPATLAWAARDARVSRTGRTRSIAFDLTTDAPTLTLGWFVLGSMRVERDVQYAGQHLAPFAAEPHREVILDSAVAALRALPAAGRARHLRALHAASLGELEARLAPTLSPTRRGALAGVRASETSLDGRHHMALEILVDPRRASTRIDGSTVRVAARADAPLRFTVRVSTDGEPLAPLDREAIFDPAFLAFADSLRAETPRIERQIRAVELLSSRQKLMAGMPTYATYFGRDQMMSALMMQPIWRPAMLEHVIGSVLRKLKDNGEVSHEEALGGQAIREAAGEYVDLLRRARAQTDSSTVLRDRARSVLVTLDRVRENYHMIDDEFQLPVVVARYLGDSRLGADGKRRFLLGRERPGGPTRLTRLLRELDVVARYAQPYVAQQLPTNLVAFAPRDGTHWASSSWRDSGAGYANGKFAMDINAIWVPRALRSMGEIFASLRTLGLLTDRGVAGGGTGGMTPLVARYAADSARLAHDQEIWSHAVNHFIVRLAPAEMRSRIAARLAALPAAERSYWARVLERTGAATDSLSFVALSLDADGRAIPVMSTDPATALFLLDVVGHGREARSGAAFRDLSAFSREYPAGLLVGGLGPVVANDAYASAAVWDAFDRDRYHSPRVVWGREVNLLLLGLSKQIGLLAADTSLDAAARVAGERELRTLLRRVVQSVDSSGLRENELWSYEIIGDRLQPVRYGSSGDIQLWNTTSLAVRWALARLPRAARMPE